MEITAILEWFDLYEVVSEYTKSILAWTEKGTMRLKAFKCIWRKRQQHFTG
jgi:hypothetical protein